MRSKRILSFLFVLLYIRQVNAQPPSDSSDYSSSRIQAVEAYTNSSAARDRLYNGPLYSGFDHHAQGHPFFMSDTPLAGSISYDGILFPGIRLSYDLAKDVVVMNNVQKDVNFQLLPEKLEYFIIAGHRFLYLLSDSSAAGLATTGFYEELSHGRAIALIRHEKTIKIVGRTEENLTNYRQYDYYYLEVGGRYYAIHSERNLLDAFGPDKVAMRDFVKRSRLRFRKDPVATLTGVASYYSKLKD